MAAEIKLYACFWLAEMVILVNFGVKKPVFCTFCKLPRSSGSVCALFMDLKGQPWGIFSFKDR